MGEGAGDPAELDRDPDREDPGCKSGRKDAERVTPRGPQQQLEREQAVGAGQCDERGRAKEGVVGQDDTDRRDREQRVERKQRGVRPVDLPDVADEGAAARGQGVGRPEGEDAGKREGRRRLILNQLAAWARSRGRRSVRARATIVRG